VRGKGGRGERGRDTLLVLRAHALAPCAEEAPALEGELALRDEHLVRRGVLLAEPARRVLLRGGGGRGLRGLCLRLGLRERAGLAPATGTYNE
jgi:hypothetical protein